MAIAPPVVFLPNNVPCGPRNISTCSMSKSSTNCDCTWLKAKSSTATPTEGSFVTKIEINPVPRIPPATALKPFWGVRLTLGANSLSAVMSFWKVFSSCFDVMVVTATAKSCCAMSRFVPVTIISSISNRALPSWAKAPAFTHSRPGNNNVPSKALNLGLNFLSIVISPEIFISSFMFSPS